MKSPLACADFTFPLLAHDKVLDLVKLLDFEGIDIGLFEGRSHLWPSNLFKNIGASADELSKKLCDRGLKCADIFLQCDPDFTPYASNQPDNARRKTARDMFEKTVEFAARCGSHHVSGLPGVLFDSETAADSWGRCFDELAWRVELAKKANLVFSVEAHVGSLAPTPEEALKLVENVPGLTLTVDYTHFTRCGMPDSCSEPLLKHASHIHVRGADKGRLQTSFKANVIDYDRVFDILDKQNYKGYLGVEYVWIDWEHCNEVDNVSETILWRDFLRSKMK